eukprot:TRINITY_DN23237_c0_g1_i1.p1 TRINITY_DN23237_c0_g1~~TRINITY_DN23237_c0_g1_i1.p1  ORF type:complete len:569 (+),score=135.95 TRINITY_DN23237_c0_g1_i1:137-1843(+)
MARRLAAVLSVIVAAALLLGWRQARDVGPALRLLADRADAFADALSEATAPSAEANSQERAADASGFAASASSPASSPAAAATASRTDAAETAADAAAGPQETARRRSAGLTPTAPSSEMANPAQVDLGHQAGLRGGTYARSAVPAGSAEAAPPQSASAGVLGGAAARSSPRSRPASPGAAAAAKMAAGCTLGNTVSPIAFGAKGNGYIDDTAPVLEALRYGARCHAVVNIGPRGAKFLVVAGALRVSLHDTIIRLEGTLLGQSLRRWNPSLEAWPKGSCAYGELEGCTWKEGQPNPEHTRSKWNLLHLVNSTNVTIEGPGGLRAPGDTFWIERRYNASIRGYCLLKIENSADIRLLRLHLQNSPMYHVVLVGSHRIRVEGLRIAVEHQGISSARNTDGIGIVASSDVVVRNCEIESGDDNLVVKGGSHGIRIEGVRLLRGKGLAIGSLGEWGAEEWVYDVRARNVSARGSQSGARIKTWRGGRGYIDRVIFEDFRLERVKFGIKVDQTYCASSQTGGKAFCPKLGRTVRLGNIRFRDFEGTFTKKAKDVVCSKCDTLRFEGIHLSRA